jgi:inner membrane protein
MRNTLFKVVLVAGLALALSIPVSMIQNLVAERQARRNEAVQGIAEGWGQRQAVATPYVVLTYNRIWTEVKQEIVDGKTREQRTERREAGVLRFKAEDMRWSVDLRTTEKARGIYRARLYNATLEAQGRITVPARAGSADGSSRITWEAPRLVVGISDPKGIRGISALSLGGERKPFLPGTADALQPAGLHVPLPQLQPTAPAPQVLEFSFSIELAGLESFAISPMGADTSVAMRADWPHPSFQGQFLPASHAVHAGGFSADWKVSRFAAQGSATEQLGVSLVEPAGLYQRLERASKYGFLFIGLTFAAFLLLELLRPLAIHPVQYGLVGLALAMFFLLLTALSEHVAFEWAYALATLACVLLISGYLAYALGSRALGLAFGGALAGLYGALFALLKAEDYALLGGAALLFALLAAVMLATRRVDWYALALKRPSSAPL